jgi:hypothetical protein
MRMMFNKDIVAVARGQKNGVEIIAVGGKNIITQVKFFLGENGFHHTATIHPDDFVSELEDWEMVEGLKVAEICAQLEELFTPAQKSHIIETLTSLVKQTETLINKISFNLKAEEADIRS